MTSELRSAIRKLARQISKLEGKKSEAHFGDIEEILKDLAQLEAWFYQNALTNTEWPTSVITDYAHALAKRKLRPSKQQKKAIVRKKKQ